MAEEGVSERTPFRAGNVDTIQDYLHYPSNNMDKDKSTKNGPVDNGSGGHHLLTVLTVVATVIGTIAGLILRSMYPDKEWTKRELMYINFPGDIFLRMLKMLIIPLLTCSIIAAIGSLDLSLSRKIGLQSVGYYVLTTSLAVAQGIFWVLLVKPGVYTREHTKDMKNDTMAATRNVTTVDTLLDLVRNLFPSNIVEACVFQDRTVLIPPKNSSIKELTDWDLDFDTTRGTNVLGLVAFSIVFGITLARMERDQSKHVLNFITVFGDATMLITKAVIWLSPVGIVFLVMKNILEMESFTSMVTQMGLYFMTVLIGVLFHGFITVPAIYLICLGEIPFKFIMNMGPAIVTAFGTASSSATLPISMQCLEERNHIDVRVSRFVMPIGATINMDGTALYEAVAAIFISQVENISLSLGSILAISLTATMASIGAAGIPQAGLVTMVMVLDSVGLPPEKVALIITVDWLLDRFRTTVNVLGDAIGAGIVARFSQDELRKLDSIQLENIRSPDGEMYNTTQM